MMMMMMIDIGVNDRFRHEASNVSDRNSRVVFGFDEICGVSDV